MPWGSSSPPNRQAPSSSFSQLAPNGLGTWQPCQGACPGASLCQRSPSASFSARSSSAVVQQQLVTLLVTILKRCKPRAAGRALLAEGTA